MMKEQSAAKTATTETEKSVEAQEREMFQADIDFQEKLLKVIRTAGRRAFTRSQKGVVRSLVGELERGIANDRRWKASVGAETVRTHPYGDDTLSLKVSADGTKTLWSDQRGLVGSFDPEVRGGFSFIRHPDLYQFGVHTPDDLRIDGETMADAAAHSWGETGE